MNTPDTNIVPLYQDRKIIGYIVIDSVISASSSGGLRFCPDLSKEELVCGARSMTLKYGLLGLPQGGAKGGIIGDPDVSEEVRQSKLKAFAHAAHQSLVKREYIPYIDIGTTQADIQYIFEALGMKSEGRTHLLSNSSLYTAISVFNCIISCLSKIDKNLKDSTVAVEGFGKVGRALAQLLYSNGAKIIAVSNRYGAVYNPNGLDITALNQFDEHSFYHAVGSKKFGEEIPNSDLLTLPVDVLSPCARYHSINNDNVHSIQSRIICVGANNAIKPESEKILGDKNIFSLPGFFSNCGGVLGGTMEYAGLTKETIEPFISNWFQILTDQLLQASIKQGKSCREIAQTFALKRHQRVKTTKRKKLLKTYCFDTGLKVYKRGMIPKSLIRRPAYQFFHRLLSEIAF